MKTFILSIISAETLIENYSSFYIFVRFGGKIEIKVEACLIITRITRCADLGECFGIWAQFLGYGIGELPAFDVVHIFVCVEIGRTVKRRILACSNNAKTNAQKHLNTVEPALNGR